MTKRVVAARNSAKRFRSISVIGDYNNQSNSSSHRAPTETGGTTCDGRRSSREQVVRPPPPRRQPHTPSTSIVTAQHLRLPRIRIPLLLLLLLLFRTRWRRRPEGACRRVAARAEPISCAHYLNTSDSGERWVF